MCHAGMVERTEVMRVIEVDGVMTSYLVAESGPPCIGGSWIA